MKDNEKIKINRFIRAFVVIEILMIIVVGNLLIRDVEKMDKEMRAFHGEEKVQMQADIEKKEVEEVSQALNMEYIPDPVEVAPVQLEEEYYDSLEELALCVEAESGNQPLEGRQMVAAVILNRVDDTEFPNTVKEVIEQKGQFTSFWDGSMARIKIPSETSIQAVQQELKERKYKTIFYFRAERYSKYGTPAWKYGEHYFNKK